MVVYPQRKPLPKYLCVDEVFLDIDYKHRYALVLLNWETGEIIDILPSRRKEETKKYFLSIPKEERDNVETLICDMYNPYINYTKDYFNKARCCIDSLCKALHKLSIRLSSLIKSVFDNCKLKPQNFLLPAYIITIHHISGIWYFLYKSMREIKSKCKQNTSGHQKCSPFKSLTC